MDKYEEAVRIVNNYIRGLKECYENACDIVGDKSKTPAVRAKHARNAEEFYTLYNEVNCILQDIISLDESKLYAPAVALGTLSIASIVASHNILKKRNVALAAAYATVDKTFKEYRNRVVERFGAEVDKELRYNIKAKKFEKTVTDPDSGKEKKVKSTVDVAAPSTNDYARFFDESCEAYESNMDYNLMYLRSQQNLANDKLKANGYLFLSDVYDQLGIKRTKMSQIVGWIYKPEGNENGDNFVDFGILETNRETEDGGYEKAILMEFNVDGPILDLI